MVFEDYAFNVLKRNAATRTYLIRFAVYIVHIGGFVKQVFFLTRLILGFLLCSTCNCVVHVAFLII